MKSSLPKRENISGCLLGTAVGDALGLAYEGLSARVIKKIFKRNDRYAFLFGKGIVSDDTEHACITAQAFLKSSNNVEFFTKSMGWSLRFWLLGIPVGIGKATLKSLLKLCLGFPPGKSGVYSAGNGPAMRAPILGVMLGNDPKKLKEYVKACTRITHFDPKAEIGAFTAAYAAYYGMKNGPEKINCTDFFSELTKHIKPDQEFEKIIEKITESVASGDSTEVFAEEIDQKEKISGYIYTTMAAVLFCWFRWKNDFHQSLTEIIRMGGDTDTTAAILGGIAGATCGKRSIPKSLLDNLFEWPRSVSWMEKVSEYLYLKYVQKEDKTKVSLFWPGVFVRNVFFLGVIIFHAIYRIIYLFY